MESAVLDACVLFQGKLTNLLLCLAEAGAFDPVWSEAIQEEWVRSLQARMRLPAEKTDYRAREMEKAFPSANVAAPTKLLAEIQALCRTKAQRQDAHVIATAIAAEAKIIVTENLPDFAQVVLDRHGLRTVRPDRFCLDLYAADGEMFLAGICARRESMQRPAYTADEYLALLAGDKFRIPKTAAVLVPHRQEI
jgi:predicted nucleic acid-binding protein